MWFSLQVLIRGNDTAGCTQVIFRHNRVLVQNQGTVLKKSSHRGVHPGHFPSREGENERRPISCAHSSWIKRSTLLCRKMTWVHPVVSFPLLITYIVPASKPLFTVLNDGLSIYVQVAFLWRQYTCGIDMSTDVLQHYADPRSCGGEGLLLLATGKNSVCILNLLFS